MGMVRRGGGRAAWLVVVCLLVSGPAIRAAEWEWDLVPYLWAAGAGLDVAVNDDEVLEGDVAFTDLIDKVDMALMVHFEGRTGRAGFFVDGAYLSTSDSTTTPPAPPLLPAGATADSKLTMGRYEAAGFFRLANEKVGFDLFVGVRAIDFDQKVDLSWTEPRPDGTSADAAATFVDGFIGARIGIPFGERFWFNARADAGAGDTKLSWTANAGFGVWFGQHRKYGLELAYEHFEFEVEEPGGLVNVTTTCQMSGPLVGFVIRF